MKEKDNVIRLHLNRAGAVVPEKTQKSNYIVADKWIAFAFGLACFTVGFLAATIACFVSIAIARG